jgi:sulfofructose kinase
MNEGTKGELLVFVGVCTLDTIALVRSFPEPDSRAVAEDFVTAGGGPAATAAVAAARAGAQTAFIGTVGDDDEGGRILAGLDSEGVDTSAVVREPGRGSGASVVIVGPHATRAIVTRPVPELVVERPAASRLIEHAAWVHLDHLGWPALPAIRQLGDSFRVSVDAGNPIPGFSPAGVDLYGPTLARLAAPGPSPRGRAEAEALLRQARELGAGAVVATDGERGSWTLDHGGRFLHVPADGQPVYSTLGAGDVFHGALLAGVASGLDLAEAARFASETAAASCAGLDGRSRIPRRLPTREGAAS